MPAKQLEEALAVLLGRTHGTCNGCGGEGKVASWEASYPFSAENVQEFAEFLELLSQVGIYDKMGILFY